MAWQRLHFERYRRVPLLFSSKTGWFFKHSVGPLEFERANIPTPTLIRLLDEEKAWLMVDEEEWRKLVAKYRGKTTAHGDGAAKCKEERAKKAKELERLGKELAARKADAQRLAAKDPKKASDVLREAAALQQKGEALKAEIAKLDQEIAKLQKK